MPFTKDFEHFQCFNFETSFLKNEIFFWKTGVPFFSWIHYYWKRIMSIQKWPVKSQILSLIKCGIQSRPMTMKADLSLSAQFIWKFNFTMRTSLYTFMCILILFLRALVSFESVFSLWESLKRETEKQQPGSVL